jgi:hypothetical protein
MSPARADAIHQNSAGNAALLTGLSDTIGPIGSPLKKTWIITMFPGWGYSQFSDKLTNLCQSTPETRGLNVLQSKCGMFTHEPIVKLLSNAVYKNIPKPDL